MQTVTISAYPDTHDGFLQAIDEAGAGGTVLLDESREVGEFTAQNITFDGNGVVRDDLTIARGNSLLCGGRNVDVFCHAGENVAFVRGLEIVGQRNAARAIEVHSPNLHVIDSTIRNFGRPGEFNVGVEAHGQDVKGMRVLRSTIRDIRNNGKTSGRARGIRFSTSVKGQKSPEDVHIFATTIADIVSENNDTEPNSLKITTDDDGDGIVLQNFARNSGWDGIKVYACVFTRCEKRAAKWQSPGMVIRSCEAWTDNGDGFRCFFENTLGSDGAVVRNTKMTLAARDTSFAAFIHMNGSRSDALEGIDIRNNTMIATVPQDGKYSGAFIELRGSLAEGSSISDNRGHGDMQIGDLIRGDATGFMPTTFHGKVKTRRKFKQSS